MEKSKKELKDENTELKVKIILLSSEIAKLNKVIKDLQNLYI